MSIALMTLAWKSDYQTGKKMVLLALCDNANDQGECYPSVSMLSKKCSMSERSVFNQIADLEKDGAIRRENRTGRSTIYHLDPCKFCTPANSAPLQPLHPTPATVAPIPLQPLHPTPATVAPITINEPSIEPSSNQKRSAAALACPSDVDQQVWNDWLQLRKTKKAAVSATVLKEARREAEKAGLDLQRFLEIWCARGSQGLQAEWLVDKKSTAATETTYQKSMRLRVAEISPELARAAPGQQNPTEFFRTVGLPNATILEIEQ